jgi:hypothetical protein
MACGCCQDSKGVQHRVCVQFDLLLLPLSIAAADAGAAGSEVWLCLALTLLLATNRGAQPRLLLLLRLLLVLLPPPGRMLQLSTQRPLQAVQGAGSGGSTWAYATDTNVCIEVMILCSSRTRRLTRVRWLTRVNWAGGELLCGLLAIGSQPNKQMR